MGGGASGGGGLTAAALAKASKGIIEEDDDMELCAMESGDDDVDVDESIFDAGGTATALSQGALSASSQPLLKGF